MSETSSCQSLYKSISDQSSPKKEVKSVAISLIPNDKPIVQTISLVKILELEKSSPFFVPRQLLKTNQLIWLTDQIISMEEVKNLLEIGKTQNRKFHINFIRTKSNQQELDNINNLQQLYKQTFVSYSIDDLTYPQELDIVNAFNKSEKKFLKAYNKANKNSESEQELDDSDKESQLNGSIETNKAEISFLDDNRKYEEIEFDKLKNKVDKLYGKRNLSTGIAEVANFLETQFDKSLENFFDETVDNQIKRILGVNNPESILKFYEIQIQQDESNYYNHFRLGEVLYYLEKYDEALEQLQMAYSIEKKQSEVTLRLLMTYYKMGKYDELKDFCYSLLYENKKNVNAMLFLGLIEQHESNQNRAKVYYTDVVSEKPELITSYLFKAKYYLDQNELKSAQDQLLIMDILDPLDQAYKKERNDLRTRTANIGDEKKFNLDYKNIWWEWLKKPLR